MKYLAVILSVLFVFADSAEARPRKRAKAAGCKKITRLPSQHLYKPTNEHGGRGPSLIAGWDNSGAWPPCVSLNIYNRRGKTIGRFGCYDPGSMPWGRRFYTGVAGGSYTSAAGLLQGARSAKSTEILIDVSLAQNKGLCWRVGNPMSREGSVRSQSSGVESPIVDPQEPPRPTPTPTRRPSPYPGGDNGWGLL